MLCTAFALRRFGVLYCLCVSIVLCVHQQCTACASALYCLCVSIVLLVRQHCAACASALYCFRLTARAAPLRRVPVLKRGCEATALLCCIVLLLRDCTVPRFCVSYRFCVIAPRVCCKERGCVSAPRSARRLASEPYDSNCFRGVDVLQAGARTLQS